MLFVIHLIKADRERDTNLVVKKRTEILIMQGRIFTQAHLALPEDYKEEDEDPAFTLPASSPLAKRMKKSDSCPVCYGTMQKKRRATTG